MGVFFQTAILPGASEADARRAVAWAAGQPGYELTPASCRYVSRGVPNVGKAGSVKAVGGIGGAAGEETAGAGRDGGLAAPRQVRVGVQIFFGEEAPGFSELARDLSKGWKGPVLLAYIYDGDFWGYDLYDDGREMDRYEGMTDYFGETSQQERRRAAGKPECAEEKLECAGGNPKLVADYFGMCADDIGKYLVPWTEDLLEGDSLAYPGDQYSYGDCWQLADFLGKLGWSVDMDVPGKPEAPSSRSAGASPDPTLKQILLGGLPPRPMDNPRIPAWNANTYYHTGNLPTVLDRNYILGLLEQEDLRELADKTPYQVIEVGQKARAAIKYPSLQHIDPRLAVLSAYCKYWLGHAEGTFWDLYEAVYKDGDNVALLRGRSLLVALFTKRHIAIKDLTRLLELDPENRDVYLLCRAFFYDMDRAKGNLADADLAELDVLGVPAQDDSRVHWTGFTEEFLRKVGREWR